MRRTKEEAALTRQQILSAALSVFGAKGYSAATLEDIAQAAGVTRGAIYWHFEDKAGLYNSLMQDYSARGAEIAQGAIDQGGSLLVILKRVFVDLLRAVESEDSLRAMMELQLFKTELTEELLPGGQLQVQAGRALIASIAAALQQGVEDGVLRADLEPYDMARAFMALQNGAIQLWLMDPDAFSLSRVAEPLAEIYMDGIVPAGQETRA
jgi:TetR/AcrR family acrAB operon transcriptional repressor